MSSILQIGNSWFPTMSGGLNRYVYDLIHYLAKHQNQVEVCGVGLPPFEPESPIEFTQLAELNCSLLQRLWLTRKNFKNRPLNDLDAINLHFALYSFPLLSSFPKNVPITFTFHGPWALESDREGSNKLSVWVKHWIEQRVYDRCDRFIVLSKAFGDILHQHYRIPRTKIHIIPGGVDIDRFQPNLSRQEARKKLNWHLDRPILFTPRRLVRRMGIETLLTALHQVRSQIPDVWLAIAGKGILRETLERQAIELGLADNVKFLGFVPDELLPVAYQAADLTVVPSQSLEGFGLIVLESLACGTPVLCTPVGGMPEILQPFSPESITASTDENAIAQHLKAILTEEISLPSRDACRDYAATNFNWTKIAQQVQQVLLAN